jgi:hypothetical protein
MRKSLNPLSFPRVCLLFICEMARKMKKSKKSRSEEKSKNFAPSSSSHRKAERLPLFHSLSLSPRRIQQQQHLIMVSVRKRISRTFFCHQQMHELLHFVASNRACEDVVVLFALLIFLALSLQAAAAEKELLLT